MVQNKRLIIQTHLNCRDIFLYFKKLNGNKKLTNKKMEGINMAKNKDTEWHKYRSDELVGQFTTPNETVRRG